MRDLGALDGANSTATAVSPDGQVTGCATTFGKGRHAFRYASGVMQDLGSLGGTESCGNGINQAGDMTGALRLPDSSWRAFIYRDGEARVFGLGGSRSGGYAINALGQVTGETDCDFDWGLNCRAFLYTDGTMLDLGTLGGVQSVGLAINLRGEVTGYYSDKYYSQRAFLYTDGAMYDLNSLVVSGLDEDFTLYEARGINDSRQIAATAGNKDGRSIAFRLDPVPGSFVQAVEYYYGVFDHYFVTANPAEIAKLDNGGLSGWVRTGETFNVWTQPNPSLSPTCRFFTTAFAPKSSHFYTPFVAECAAIKGDPSWQSEGIAFYVQIPTGYGTGNGSCPDGTVALYRAYNGGMGGAPNHRYTTNLATLSAMIAQGWIFEGEANTKVFACVPQ
jgi:probable HAF family extracellular repeat protein